MQAQLRWVTLSLREPKVFCLRMMAFFQDGLMQATAFSSGSVHSRVPR